MFSIEDISQRQELFSLCELPRMRHPPASGRDCRHGYQAESLMPFVRHSWKLWKGRSHYRKCSTHVDVIQESSIDIIDFALIFASLNERGWREEKMISKCTGTAARWTTWTGKCRHE